MSEAKDRVVIDDWLRRSNWILTDHEGEKRNVDFEVRGKGRVDYTLYDSNNFPLCALEANTYNDFVCESSVKLLKTSITASGLKF